MAGSWVMRLEVSGAVFKSLMGNQPGGGGGFAWLAIGDLSMA